MAFLQSSEEREQIASLKAHQKAVREHKSAKSRVDALAEALADAQTDHRTTGSERATAKSNLLSVLEEV
jgi:hypothetical protein